MSLAGRLAIEQLSGTTSSSRQGTIPRSPSPSLPRIPSSRSTRKGSDYGASPCRRVDSDEPNAPGDVSQSSGLRGPVARGMVPRLQDRSQTDVPQ